MPSHECPGLPAEWLNAWLAAVGVTVLVPDIRLSWTDGASPHAVLHAPDGSDPMDLLVDAWPAKERIADMPIAQKWRGLQPMERTVPLAVFQDRARHGRSHDDIWTLSSTVTDLSLSGGNPKRPPEVEHSKLDPAGPGTVKWLHHRLGRVAEKIDDPARCIAASFTGRPQRVRDNGLGFDLTRVTSLADSSTKRVDPVVETLAFFGLKLLPMRGNGMAQGASTGSWHSHVRQRSWYLDPDSGRRRRMIWPAWSQPLQMCGIDALLDIWCPRQRHRWRQFGVHSAWCSTEFEARGSADTTRGIGSQPL